MHIYTKRHGCSGLYPERQTAPQGAEKAIGLALLLLFGINAASSQAILEHKSIHQIESEAHKDIRSLDVALPVPALSIVRKSGAGVLSRKVFGWHPYWASSTAYLSYDYAALTHIGYFSYETDPATGGYTTVNGWTTTPIIEYAHQRGVKVVLVVTSFGSSANTQLLSDTARQNTMINNLIDLLRTRNGDGVNFDLESVPVGQKANLVSFMQRAASKIKADVPGAEISMATPAVDWSNAWDFPQLAQICDYLIVMGYDYYWSGSTTAGPVAPLQGENYNVTRSVDTYLNGGVPASKLFLGVPWYGYDWPVQSSDRKAAATGTATARVYSAARSLAQSYGATFDATTKVPWVSYQSGSWRQLWYDDSTSLAMKYGLVNSRNLGGIGIWALSYQGAGAEIWNGIKGAFILTTALQSHTELPELPSLLQNYPNPFNPGTTIGFSLPAESFVSLKVYDMLGREVVDLAEGNRPAGRQTIEWNGTDAHGQPLPSGVYFCRLIARSADGSAIVVDGRKMLLLR